MITTNDIGQQFLDTRDPACNPVTLIALDTWKGVPMAAVFAPHMANPSAIPGLDEYWVRVDRLVPLTSAH